MAAPVDEFWSRYADWQKTLREKFLDVAEDKALAARQIDAALNNSELLAALPYEEAERIKEKFRWGVLRFDEVFDPDTFSAIGDEISPGRYVGRVASGSFAEDDPIGFVLRQLSIQKDEARGVGTQQFYFGRNIPQMEYMQSQMEQVLSGKKLGPQAKVLVFDTETVGLSSDMAGVREVASLNLRMKGGTLVSDAADEIQKASFNVSRSGYGTLYNQETGKYTQLDAHFKRLAGGTLMPGEAGSGDDFAEAIAPLLKQMKAADNIAGHNVHFDIGQIILNATKTGAYNRGAIVGGDNFTELVDSVIAKIKRGDVIDTLVRAKQYFGDDLPIAKELAAMGERRPYGLENILLETNLSQLIKAEPGGEEIFKGMQHTADYDTFITGQLLRFMESGQLSVVEGGVQDFALRRSTLRSYAPTPTSYIADVRDISPEFFARVYETDQKRIKIASIGTGDLADVDSRTADEWYRELIGDDTTFSSRVKVNAIEQQSFATSKILSGHGVEYSGTNRIIDNIGQWRTFSEYSVPYQGRLNKLHSLFKRAQMPTEADYAALQHKFAKAGMPFAGISLPERILTGALSSASGLDSTARRAMDPFDADVAKFGDDIGLSSFALKEAKAGDNFVALPLQLLGDAGLDIGPGKMLSLSTVHGSKKVNLMYQLEDKQADDLVNYIRGLHASDQETAAKYGIRAENIDFIERSIRSRGAEYGINVGVMDKEAGRQAYAAITNMFGNIRDEALPPLRVGIANVGEKNVQVGAVVMDRYWDKAQRAAYTKDLGLATQRATELGTALGDYGTRLRAEILYKTGMADLAKRAEDTYTAIVKRAPIAGAVGLGVLGAYYMYKSHKEEEFYDQSLDPMPTQSGGDYRTYRNEMGLPPAPARRRTDYLATAGVVGNLDRGAIGHTGMGPQKDRGLFASVM